MIKGGDTINVELETKTELWITYETHTCFKCCPACNTLGAPLSTYEEPLLEHINKVINCEVCFSEFKLLKYNYPNAVVKVIKIKEKNND